MSGDLISRKALRDEVRTLKAEAEPFQNSTYKTGYISALSTVEGVLAYADVLEVVRCKDCVYRMDVNECPMCWTEWFEDAFDGMDCVTRDNTTDDGFCHKGAKMDLEEE